MKDDAIAKKMRQGQFVRNNGRVLRAINIMRRKYERLQDVQYALSDIPEDQYLDSINFLDEAGYIKLRDIVSRDKTHLEDADEYTDLEAKLTSTGIRLLGGEISDRMVDA